MPSCSKAETRQGGETQTVVQCPWQPIHTGWVPPCLLSLASSHSLATAPCTGPTQSLRQSAASYPYPSSLFCVPKRPTPHVASTLVNICHLIMLSELKPDPPKSLGKFTLTFLWEHLLGDPAPTLHSSETGSPQATARIRLQWDTRQEPWGQACQGTHPVTTAF